MGAYRNAVLGIAAMVSLVSCGSQDIVLPGERLAIRGGAGGDVAVAANQVAPVRLSAPINHLSWTHRAGTASHRLQHPAFSAAPSQLWAVDIGAGSDKRHRIAADPVAANGLIYTMDSRAGVVATSVSGVVSWRRDLTPPAENSDDASGGGLAISNGNIYVTTGFGDLFALDAASGSTNWQQRLDAPATGAPTISDNIVYVVTRDSRALAIDAANGRLLWQLDSPPSVSGVVGGAAPAVGNGLVVLPFGTAQMVAAFPKGGLQVWRSSVAGARPGRAYAQLSDISADPVIHGKTVFTGNPSGRMVAIDIETGDNIWSAPEGATGPVWVEGGSVFLVSDQAELVRLNARSGERIWGIQLPSVVPTRNVRRQRDVYAHFGPVLAGGQLWIGSGDGQLRAYNPVDGSLEFIAELPDAAATRPIVVDGVMYLVLANGQLLAFR
ncbi:MAG: PQQ-binding-like beta-propeller repeat protein [Paracoccaceae bacterium]